MVSITIRHSENAPIIKEVEVCVGDNIRYYNGNKAKKLARIIYTKEEVLLQYLLRYFI